MKTLGFPDRITVELTNQCNVSCSFCPRQKTQMQIGYMDMGLYKKVIDEAAMHLPVKLVLFFRGESLLHPQFAECLRYAKEKGIGPVQFASNGLALDEKAAGQMLDAGIDFISFSLDTLSPEVYKATRQHGDLKASMENVIRLGEMCKERKSKGLPVPALQVSTIELEEYKRHQQEFIDFWKQHVDIVRVYYEHDEKGKFKDTGVAAKLTLAEGRRPCRKVFTDMLLYWDGSLALCNYDWNGEVGLNASNMSLYEAWHSEPYESIRKMQQEGRFTKGLICRECEHWRIDYMPEGFLGKMYRQDGPC
ncbi:MAG: radical SAM protein [Eubacterium sp.]|nr:radical SAM protein [Eubacterium sp.]